jgi:hypothetical protein
MKTELVKSSRCVRVLIALLLCIPSSVLAERLRVEIARIDTPPKIDGSLDDAIWSQASVIDDFKQVNPVKGAAPSERTEVYLAYDADMIYIGVRCYDSEPELMIAKELRDDGDLRSGDRVLITLDTFLDRRNAFGFEVNMIGGKLDARIENNSKFARHWDGIWYADGARDDEGWTVELAIPTKTLSFNPGTDVWGFDVERLIKRRNETVRWSNISQDRSMVYARAYGDITGLKGLDQGMGLDIKPAIASNFRWRDAGDDQDFKLAPGGELIYRFTPSLTGSLVLNPDFSDARVDEIQTNLTRFRLFFPEQRDFFVRDADIFQFAGLEDVNGMPFFSRRIGLAGDIDNPDTVDLQAGAKLTGRVGRYTLGLLNSQMGALGEIDAKNLTVMRGAADIHNESRVGMLMTYGDPLSDDDNGMVGADYRYRNSYVFGDQTFVADVFAMRSFTSGRDGDEMSYGLRLNYPNDKWHARANFTEIQRNFNPALGFVNRPGIRKYDGQLRYRVRPARGHYLRTMDWGVRWDVTTDSNDQLRSLIVQTRFFEIANQIGDTLQTWLHYQREKLVRPFEISRGVVIPAGKYRWIRNFTKFETNNSRPIKALVQWTAGEFFDGTQVDFIAKLEWRPNPHFFASIQHQNINTNLPAGDFDVEVNRLKLDALFNPRVSWTNFIQHESESHLITLNSQLRWIVTPGTELTLTLNHDMQREDRFERPSAGYSSHELDFSTQFYWTQRF